MPKDNLSRDDGGLSDINQRIRDMETANPLENGSVDNGTLTVRSSSDGLVIEATGQFWAKEGARMLIESLLEAASVQVTGPATIGGILTANGNLVANNQLQVNNGLFVTGGATLTGHTNLNGTARTVDTHTVDGELILNDQMFAHGLAERDSLENTRVMAVGDSGRVYSIPWPSGGGTVGPVEGGDGMKSPFPWTSVTSEFGPRNIPGTSPFHRGIDFGIWPAVGGATIVAPAGGVVSSVSLHSDAGPYGFQINHGTYSDGATLITEYWHCASRFVSLGDTVTQGQAIATVGNLGNSRGAHLHWQTGVNGAWVNPRSFVATYANG